MAKIAMNSTTTMLCNVIAEIGIAKEVGFQGIEIMAEKLFRYMEADCDLKELIPLLDGIEVVAIGALQNLERQGDLYKGYLDDVHRYCAVAQVLGARMVQMCTGPSDVQTVMDFAAGRITIDDQRYMGSLGKSEEEMIAIAAKNVAAAADIAADYGIELYLEPLAWTPIRKISQAVQVIGEAGRDNVGIVIDLWHMWTAGESPEYISSLDKEIIKIVHICDGMDYNRSEIPNQDDLRNVWIGEGDIPIGRYIRAIKETGYDGWYSTETFCRRGFEKDPIETARTLKLTYEYLLN